MHHKEVKAMKKHAGILALMLSLATIPAIAYDNLYAHNGQYLGNTSSNQFDTNSINNQFGQYGSKFSPTSINNQFSQYGGQFGQYSPYNKFSSQPPIAVPQYSSAGYGQVYQPGGLMNGASQIAPISTPSYGYPTTVNTGMQNYGVPNYGVQPTNYNYGTNYGVQPMNANYANAQQQSYNTNPANNMNQQAPRRGGLLGLGARVFRGLTRP